MKKPDQRSSEVLIEIVQDKSLTTYRDVLGKLGNRAFGISILFFALPSALPLSVIPGVSLIFSLPIFIFSLEMMVGRKTLWLPKMMADRPITQNAIAKMLNFAIPYVKKMEKLLKPRWHLMTSMLLNVVNGMTLAALSLLLMLPIPISNFVFSLLIIFFSLGLAQKDGVFIVIGYAGTILYFFFFYLIILTALGRVFH